MFDKDFKITGKHANNWKDLCELAGNVPDRDQHSSFGILSHICAADDRYAVIKRLQKRASTAEEIPPRTPSFYENAEKYAICGYKGKK